MKKQAITSTTCRIYHACNIGDSIGALAAAKRYYELTGRKIIFCQRLNMPAAYYTSAIHPTVNPETGEMVTMNESMWNMLVPLLEAQEYIYSCEVFNGQDIDLDFNVIRGKTFVNLPHGSLSSWLFYAFPDLACDLASAWITLPQKKHPIQSKTKGKIVLNFTERYRNHNITYHFLKKYQDDLIFAGTEKEYLLFVNTWGLDIDRLQVNDFLELTYALKAARFTLSNQSMIWNICESAKFPRVLEVCQYAQNNLPFYGDDSYGYFHQVGAEYYVQLLHNQTK